MLHFSQCFRIQEWKIAQNFNSVFDGEQRECLKREMKRGPNVRVVGKGIKNCVVMNSVKSLAYEVNSTLQLEDLFF